MSCWHNTTAFKYIKKIHVKNTGTVEPCCVEKQDELK